MTTFAPEEVRRMVQRFETEALAAKLVAPKPVKKHHIPIMVRSCAKAMAQINADVARIVPVLASIWNVSPEMVLFKGRKQPSINARLMVYAWLRNQGYSLPMIAMATKHIDHGTVVSGLRRWQAHMDTLPEFRAAWERFTEAVNP